MCCSIYFGGSPKYGAVREWKLRRVFGVVVALLRGWFFAGANTNYANKYGSSPCATLSIWCSANALSNISTNSMAI